MQPFEASSVSSRYYLNQNGPYTLALRMELTMSKAIDTPAMQRALEQAAQAHPQFACRVGFAGGRIWYIPCGEPPLMYDTEAPSCSLGGADTNHYQYRVWAQDNRLGIVCNHGLADGRYLTGFVSTLLLYYAYETGAVPRGTRLDGIALTGDKSIPTFDPHIRYANRDVSPAPPPDIGPLFGLPVEYRDEHGDYTCEHDVIIASAPELLGAAHELGSRVSPLIATLQARALDALWGLEGRSALMPIMCDMRPYYDSAGVGNFSNWVISMLPASLASADLAIQAGAARQGMETQLTDDYLRAQMGRALQEAEDARQTSLDEVLTAHERLATKVRQTRQIVATQTSNIGALPLPSPLDQMVVAAECGLPSWSSALNLTMIGTKKEVRLSINRTFDTNELTLALADQIKALGVPARVEQHGRRPYPQMRREGFLDMDNE